MSNKDTKIEYKGTDGGLAMIVNGALIGWILKTNKGYVFKVQGFLSKEIDNKISLQQVPLILS